MNGTMNSTSFTASHRQYSRTIAEYICDLIAENDKEIHVIFCQLDTLMKQDDKHIWQEAARWVKYEEDVEENGKRWSKPHVASLTLSNVLELKSQLSSGVVMLDVDASSVNQVADLLLDELATTTSLDANTRNTIRTVLLGRHVHRHLKRRRAARKGIGNQNGKQVSDVETQEPKFKLNKHFMKKIPQGAEVANVWVGEVEKLERPITAFIRLKEASFIGDLTEVALPTRFLFVHLTPVGVPGHSFQLGRGMSTMLVDEIFSEVAYKAKTKQDIMNGVDEFLDQVTVLPPGQWDPEIRLDPPTKVPSQMKRKESQAVFKEETEGHGDLTLVRTGKLFGGLIADVKRKLPHYFSDFRDGLHIQCIGTIFYIYLATLTPNITFGALLGQSTEQFMGPMECIMAIAFVNIMWALFSGQPLIVMGSTGPVLVLETIIFNMCRDNGWHFLPFRVWIGLWSALYLMIMVAFDLSALVRYITRFTEESFACLISLIFIVEAFAKLFEVADKFPYNTHPEIPLDYTCSCINRTDTSNMTVIAGTTDAMPGYSVESSTMMSVLNVTKMDCIKYGGVLVGSGCNTTEYQDNVFFLSFILTIGTFALAWNLVALKRSTFFPTFVRQIVGDFAVFISICVMVGIDAIIGVNTPKLVIPKDIQPSRPDRGWFINPISDRNPWWLPIIAALPAIVAVILIFMDQQITAVIINRKENKLKKGSGYHLDLTVCVFCIVGCSFFGLPWYVAATVRSMVHINSLRKESECTAPGEKSVFLGCREQRVTQLVVAILNGCCVFMTGILKYVPMPVLYGVFLYMGLSSLRGMQFFDRILILFMPAKYQPDHIYLRHVRAKRVHMFTIIQVLCLAVLWTIKVLKSISIAFPLMVLGTCLVRKALEKIFTKNELKWLDELMPEDRMMKKEDEGELSVDDETDEDENPSEIKKKNPPVIRFQDEENEFDNVTWNVKKEGAQMRSKNGEHRGLLKSDNEDMPMV